uniref:Uncharacterized protein n=1 Tax=viral metagenome TaxID=1070528 RepID=A0A6C0AYH3_9ZZZZ|tara:strand:- start:3719 stop:4849 length:1131 start_codon:yes stop_codon:yes gene_type:complete
MDDYSINSLTESKNEWCARLVSILSHCVISGIRSIFDEAVKLCADSKEDNKYLMTFQNLLSQIPQWNPNTIENEKNRIEAVSGCKYLEDLITCVHIIQLKALTCIRVGQKQKKIDIDIPSIDKFIHQIYINCARKLYTNIYLFEKDIYPLQIQKNNRELEYLIKEAILLTIRDNIPVDQILRAYIDETEEQELNVLDEKLSKNSKEGVLDISNQEINSVSPIIEPSPVMNISKEPKTLEHAVEQMAKDIEKPDDNEIIEPEITIDTNDTNDTNDSIDSNDSNDSNSLEKIAGSINFSNIDNVIDNKNNEHKILAPKDLETLERKAAIINQKNKEEEEEENLKLNIGDDIKLDMETINLSNSLELDDSPVLTDVEEL